MNKLIINGVLRYHDETDINELKSEVKGVLAYGEHNGICSNGVTILPVELFVSNFSIVFPRA